MIGRCTCGRPTEVSADEKASIQAGRRRHRSLPPRGRDGTARVWEVATRAERHVLRGHGGGVRSAVFSPDGTLVVTAGRDGTARVWEVATGAERHVLRGHEQGLVSAVFSPDGTLVVTAGNDWTARVWEVATGAERHALRGHEQGVVSAVFSPDGMLVVTAGDDGPGRIWDFPGIDTLLALASRRVFRSLTAEERQAFGLPVIA